MVKIRDFFPHKIQIVSNARNNGARYLVSRLTACYWWEFFLRAAHL